MERLILPAIQSVGFPLRTERMRQTISDSSLKNRGTCIMPFVSKFLSLSLTSMTAEPSSAHLPPSGMLAITTSHEDRKDTSCDTQSDSDDDGGSPTLESDTDSDDDEDGGLSALEDTPASPDVHTSRPDAATNSEDELPDFAHSMPFIVGERCHFIFTAQAIN
jgi:hypothetical protein